jgi:uncharacterized protein (TIRG00374 family)
VSAGQNGSFWRNAPRWLPGIVISGIALIALFKFADLDKLKQALLSIQPLTLAAVIALTLISLGLRARAWQILLGKQASFKDAFFILNEGYLLNNLLPLRAGEIGRSVFMGQSSKLGTFHVLSTILLERTFDVSIAAVLLLSTLPLAFNMDWARPVAWMAFVIVIAALVALYLTARYHEWVHQKIETLFGRWSWFRRLVLPRLDSLLNGLGALTDPWQFFSAYAFLAASWGLSLFFYFLIMSSLMPQAAFWWSAFLHGVISIGISVPSAPGALGVYEAAITGGLAALGVSNSVALAFALVMRAVQFFTTGLLGLLGLVQEGRSFSALFSVLRTQNND